MIQKICKKSHYKIYATFFISILSIFISINFVYASSLYNKNLTKEAEKLSKLLVDYNTKKGISLFKDIGTNADFWRLNRFFVTQKYRSYCGVATSVMVLNAFNITPPEDPYLFPESIFTQDNIFTKDVLKITNPTEIFLKPGHSVGQVGDILKKFVKKVDIHMAYTVPLNKFREMAKNAVQSKDKMIVVNYFRPKIGQIGNYGHISPLGAYNDSNDYFLIMDVARMTNGPVWVKTKILWDAINTQDSKNRKRGFIIVNKK